APRVALLVGRLLATLPALLGAAAVALLVGFFALHTRFLGDLPAALPHLATAAVVVLGGLVLYSVLALGGGAFFRKRPVASLLGAFAIDQALASSALGLRLLSPAHHFRAIAGLHDAGTLALPFDVPSWGSAIYLIVLLAAASWFGRRRIDQLELT